jgi:glycosyltransferase involved in cell wall biosynthesis
VARLRFAPMPTPPGQRHVALNALFLNPGVTGGPETYVRELVPELVRRHPDTRFTLLTSPRGASALEADGWCDLLPIVALPADDDQPARRTLVETFYLPDLVRRRGFDLVHSLANRGPIRAGAPHVVTIHDAIFFAHDTLGSVVSTVGMRAVVRAAGRGADAVITDSAAARTEIAEHTGVPVDRIEVVHLGAGRPVAAAPTPEPELRDRLGLGRSRVLLCVAALRPHKNQELLVRALPHLPADVTLVCAGHGEGYEQRVRGLAIDLGVADRVVLAGYADDADLEGLWDLAAAAAFPTRVEGFGLPVLEAMRRGLPLACSAIPVLREIAGDAVQWFPPDDATAAAGAIDRALAGDYDADAARRRAAGFTWARTADQTHAVYHRVLA